MGYSNQATGKKRRGQARTYDFRRPVRLAREHSHVLKMAMGTFGRQATTVLTTGLRVNCLVSMSDLEEMSYDEFIASLPPGNVCSVVLLDPLPGKSIMTLDQMTLLTLVDYILGGPGVEDQPERALTDIEQALARHMLTRLLREFSYAMEPIVATRPTLMTMESNAQFVQAAAPTDPVIVFHFEFSMGPRETQLSFCLPYATIGEPLAILSAASDDKDKLAARRQAAALTSNRLKDVQVEVALRFDPVMLPSESIWDLTVGDVVEFEHRTTTPLTVVSAESTFARAIPGSSGKKLAALVVP